MYTIRRANVDDIPVLVEFRGKMYGSKDASIDFDEIRGICEVYDLQNCTLCINEEKEGKLA